MLLNLPNEWNTYHNSCYVFDYLYSVVILEYHQIKVLTLCIEVCYGGHIINTYVSIHLLVKTSEDQFSGVSLRFRHLYSLEINLFLKIFSLWQFYSFGPFQFQFSLFSLQEVCLIILAIIGCVPGSTLKCLLRYQFSQQAKARGESRNSATFKTECFATTRNSWKEAFKGGSRNPVILFDYHQNLKRKLFLYYS